MRERAPAPSILSWTHWTARLAVLLLLNAVSVPARAQASCQSNQQQLAADKVVLANAQHAHDRRAQAAALDALGLLYEKDGQSLRAVDTFLQAESLEKLNKDTAAEAMTMAHRAHTYRVLAHQQKALALLKQALAMAKSVNNTDDIATILSITGSIDADRGSKETAMELFQQALPLCRAAHDSVCELDTLNHIAWDYDELNQNQKSFDTYNEALVISTRIGDQFQQAAMLGNIAWLYQRLGRDPEALGYLVKAMPLAVAACDYRLVGDTYTELGITYGHLGDAKRELENMRQSLQVEQQVGSVDGQALALWGMGDASSRLHDDAGILRYQMAARGLAITVHDLTLLGNIDTALMLYYRDRKQLQQSIFFGKDAVNSFQRVRRNISGMNEDVQAGFTQSKSQTYRQLAEVLVMDNRLAEAERVLDMLKEQEFREVVRGAEETLQTRTAPLQMTASQARAQSGLAAPEKIAATLTSLSLEYDELAAKDSPTTAEQARMQVLDAQITTGNKQMDDFLEKTFYEPAAQKAGAETGNGQLQNVRENISQMQNALDALGPGVLGVQMLFGDEHVYALVVTARSTESYELPIPPADLRVKVLQVRDELRHPYSDPTADLQDLYRLLVGPWSAALDDFAQRAAKLHQTPTLLWSLDGVLRYLPMAALNDGRHYMVERFNNVLFTTQSAAYMQSPPVAGKPAFHALAMGLTRSYGGLPQLPGVAPELMSVVHDDSVPGSDGPMEGKLELDDQFTLATMRSQLMHSGKYSVVHIASHFVEQAGSGKEPYLMLSGNLSGSTSGYELTLASLEDSPMRFNGIKLLTLSACSTAKGDAAQNGMEMDSIGMAAQKKGAEAVMATLWDVNDASTSRMMSEFYTRWVDHAADGKAEALRNIQLEFLHGVITAPAGAADQRGLFSDDDTPPPIGAHIAGYTHPFYWAPFILIGNYR